MNMPQKILITGAGGFLGRYIVDLLLQKGHSVSGLGRNPHPDLINKGVTWHAIDLRDYKAVLEALKGHDAIIHCASKIAMWGDWQEFLDINVEGTKNLLNAAKNHGIKKFVYTSTPSVVFGRESIIGGDENLPYPDNSVSRYGRSKAIAEKEVIRANNDRFFTCALRPHLIFGPGDDHLVPRLVDAAKSGRLKIIGDGNNEVDVIAVQNAAVAHVQALEALGPNSPVNGQAYFIAQDKPVKLWQFTNTLLSFFNVPAITKKVPFGVAYIIGAICEFIAKLAAIKSDKLPMTRFVAMQLSKSHWFKHDKAVRDFGYRPILSTEEALTLYRARLLA